MTTTTAILAPNPRFSSLDEVGNPNSNGVIYTYYDGTDVLAPTYRDPSKMVENTNPIQLDAAGEAVIFWDSSHYYSMIEYTQGGMGVGRFIRSSDRYPYVAAATGNINIYTPENLVRNPQFTFWDLGINWPLYSSYVPGYNRLITDFVADDWFFSRSNTVATVNMSKQLFPTGQVNVAANPVSYFHYECTNVSTGGETFKFLGQQYLSCQTGAGLEIAVAICAKSAYNNSITLSIIQDFGSGGTPSNPVKTNVPISINLTTNWQRYTATLTLPSVAGKTLGTNGDDTVTFCINYPLNTIASIDLCNVQFHITNAGAPPFPYLTQDDQYKRINSQITYAVSRTGDVKMTLRTVVDFGWLICDDGTIGNPTSNATHPINATKALFFLIWAQIAAGNTYFPFLNSNGTPATVGVSAQADWDASKRIGLPLTMGRVIGNAYGSYGIAQALGETTHLLTVGEMPAHSHSFVDPAGALGSALQGGNGYNDGNAQTDVQGGSMPHNNMQPTVFMFCMIKL